MGSEWREIPLSEVVSLQRGHDLPEPSRKLGNVPIIGSFGGITGYHNKTKAPGPGVTIGRSGASFGVVGFTEEAYWPLNTVLYVTDFKDNDPFYVYKLLQQINFSGFNSGSAQPSLNRNFIANINVKIPDPKTQQRISEFLRSFDDKIELGRRMNRTLEQMARALFKSWFVDFDPVRARMRGEVPGGMDAKTAALFPDELVEVDGREVPRGWRVKGLDGIADFLNGLALQKFPPTGSDDLPIIKIAQLRKGNTEGSGFANRDVGEKYTIQDGDVLFSWSGSLEVVRWAGGEGALNQHLFKITSSDYPNWFVYYWLLEHLPEFQNIAAHKATTMGHIQRKHLTEARICVPPQAILEILSREVQPLFDSIFQNDMENKRLAHIRDALLPRLLSGEVDVGGWGAETI